MQEAIVGPGAWMSVISAIIGWTFFIIVLSMIKNFLTRGFSMAIGEFLLNTATEAQREKYLRWFGNGDDILEHIKEVETVVKTGKKNG